MPITVFPSQPWEPEKLKNLRVKFGIDPTSPDLHLGHLVPLRVVKTLKDLGCNITIILGTFTAQMGDPSGRDATRPILSPEVVSSNSQKLWPQVTRILGGGEIGITSGNLEIVENGEWFESMPIAKFMGLAAKFTVSRLLSRDAFQVRQNSGHGVAAHELLVPILQGWDSVEVKAQVEIGGVDQLFNFQLTRELQEIHGHTPEICVMTPIINGTDGRKMSKSLGNCIFFNDKPEDIFGKCMSVSDQTMNEWIPLLTNGCDISHPMERKKWMAHEIVKQLQLDHADAAKIHFESTVQRKELPEDIQEVQAKDLIDVIVAVRNYSRSDARRLIVGGGVKIDNAAATENIPITTGMLIQVGKRHFARVI